MKTRSILTCWAMATLLLLFLPVDTVSSADFDTTPAPDFRTLFKMYMATHGDVLDTPDMAYEYHLLFNVPPEGPACIELNQEWSDEFRSADLIARLRPPFTQALSTAESGPTTAVFRVRAGQMVLGTYDRAKQEFPVTNFLGPLARTFVPRPNDACQTYNAQKYMWGNRGLVPSGFELVYPGNEKILNLPMSESAARAYLRAHTRPGNNINRYVTLELLLETEPVPILRGAMQPVPARIIEARFLDPDNDNVLYTYAPSLFESKVPETRVVTSDDSVLLTPFMLTLLTLRDHPEFLDDDWVIELVARQIVGEQRRWTQFDKLVARCRNLALCSEGKTAVFAYEWQKLEEDRRQLAHGPLLDVFVRPQSAWNFIKDEPEWDERFGALAEVFIFQRDQIEGRDPEFAARALLPVWKRHLVAALERIPERLSMSSQLITPQYDFDTSSFPLRPAEMLKPMPDPVFEVSRDSQRSDRLTNILPQSAQVSRIYHFTHLPKLTAARGIVEPAAYPNLHARGSAAELWRFELENFYCRTCPPESAGFLSGAILALDRGLTLKSISVPPAEAERMIEKLTVGRKSFRGEYKVRARMTFAPVRVDMGQIFSRNVAGVPTPVLFGRVELVELKSMRDEMIASYHADYFPSAAALHAAATAARQAEGRQTKEDNARATAIAKVTREKIDMRFAQCQTLVGDAGQMKPCLDAIERDQAKLQLNSHDLSRLRQSQMVVGIQLSSNEHMSGVLKELEQMQKCMALADTVEMQKCIDFAK